MNAREMMDQFNPAAAHATVDGTEIFIEDVRDPDGRWYRIEYQCSPDGSNAIAFCRHNPWEDDPFGYERSHLSDDGFICYATSLSRETSPYDLAYAVPRCRLWANGYSFMHEHGYEETCRIIPEWEA